MAKIFFLMIDGLGDVSYKDAEGKYKTPLEAAHTPTLDRLVSGGSLCGLMDPVAPGIACGSDTAHLSIFGYDPHVYHKIYFLNSVYNGRGAYESIGAGLEMKAGDIAFKCNFATLRQEDGMVISRKVDGDFSQLGPALCCYLQEQLNANAAEYPNHRIALKYATEHRLCVSISGPNLTHKISGTDPLKDNLPLLQCVPADEKEDADDAAVFTSQTINRLLMEHEINAAREKKKLPLINVVLFRGAAPLPQVKPFPMRGFMVAPTCIIAGIGQSIGLGTQTALRLHVDIIPVPEATGGYDSNWTKKTETAMTLLLSTSHEFAFVHIKAVDHASHDRSHTKKVVICVTGDHSTPVLMGDHSNEPVPIVIGRVIGSDVFPFLPPTHSFRAVSFGEVDCARGALGRMRGSQLVPLLMQIKGLNS